MILGKEELKWHDPHITMDKLLPECKSDLTWKCRYFRFNDDIKNIGGVITYRYHSGIEQHTQNSHKKYWSGVNND